MSAHAIVGDGTADVAASKKQALGAPSSRCRLGGSSSKSGGDVDHCSCSQKAAAAAAGGAHEYAAVVRSADPTDRGVVCRFSCGLGDVWFSKYPAVPPAGKKCVVTGDNCVDSAIKDLSKLNYPCIKVIERGTFSTVFLAYHEETRQNLIVKLLNKGAHSCKRKLRNHVPCSPVAGNVAELDVLKDVRHPNIAALVGHHYTSSGHLGLILEFCENGSLSDLLKMRKVGFLTEAVSLRYFRQMISPLEYLHESGIAHRNLNLRHFLVSKCDQLKLCDFGQAVKCENGDFTCHDTCGTPGYQAPELLSSPPYEADKTDIWALGVCLYVMVTGRQPFAATSASLGHPQHHEQPQPSHSSPAPRSSAAAASAATAASVAPSSSSSSFRFPEDFVMPLSAQLKQLLCGMLSHNPVHRCTINRVKHNEWLTQPDRGVFIGNFHLVRQPQKLRSSNSEKEMKQSLEI